MLPTAHTGDDGRFLLQIQMLISSIETITDKLQLLTLQPLPSVMAVGKKVSGPQEACWLKQILTDPGRGRM
jgi:hypothetical protein